MDERLAWLRLIVCSNLCVSESIFEELAQRQDGQGREYSERMKEFFDSKGDATFDAALIFYAVEEETKVHQQEGKTCSYQESFL